MSIIKEGIPQEELNRVLIQALGLLLDMLQAKNNTDHFEFDFSGFTYKVGVRDGEINVEKHVLKPRATNDK